jgi:hypothetical protein
MLPPPPRIDSDQGPLWAGHEVIPKGWPWPDREEWASAAEEAREEALTTRFAGIEASSECSGPVAKMTQG